jgi:hypothetical protein
VEYGITFNGMKREVKLKQNQNEKRKRRNRKNRPQMKKVVSSNQMVGMFLGIDLTLGEKNTTVEEELPEITEEILKTLSLDVTHLDFSERLTLDSKRLCIIIQNCRKHDLLSKKFQ